MLGRHILPTRVGISQAARLFGVTPRALRFYEGQGLVVARRDPVNVRFYDAAACRRIAWIARLRKIGVPLPEIEEVLRFEEEGEGRAAECARAKVEHRRQVLLRELEMANQALAEIRAFLPPATGRQREAQRPDHDAGETVRT